MNGTLDSSLVCKEVPLRVVVEGRFTVPNKDDGCISMNLKIIISNL
jgi:hypothetical protein